MSRFQLHDVRGASFDVSSSGDNTLWTPPYTNRSLILLGLWISVDGDVDVTLKGSHEIKSIAFSSGDSGVVDSEIGLLHTNAGQSLRMSLSAGVRCTGAIRYVQLLHSGRGIVNVETPTGI